MLDAKVIIHKYYPVGEARDIMLSHAQDVRDLALEIVDNHPELGADRDFVAEAAMLHDIGVFLVDAPRIDCHGDKPYICHGYLGREILDKEGLPLHALVCERHIGVGLKKKDIRKRNLDVPMRTMRPKSIEEKIICFADLFYSKTRLGQRIPEDIVRKKLLCHGKGKVKKFDKWREMFL